MRKYKQQHPQKEGRQQECWRCQLFKVKSLPDNFTMMILLVCMISYFMWKSLFIAAFLIVHTSSACSVTPILDIVTGSITVQGTGTSVSTFNHNFHQHLPSKPNFAFGIWNVQHTFVGVSSPNNFYAQVVDLTSANVLLAVTSSSQWQQLKIGYMTTTHSDILADTVHFSTNSLQGRSTLHYTNIMVPDASSSIMRAYLNGWTQSSASSNFSLQVDGKVVEGSRVGVLIGTTGRTNVQGVWYSYVVFSPQTAQFASYGGAIVLDQFMGVQYTNIHNNVHYSEYVLAGLSKLEGEGEYSFIAEIDDDLVLALTSSATQVSITFSYVLFGVPPRKLCQNCTQAYPFLQQCRYQCPSDTYIHTYQDGGVGCHRCSEKLNKVINVEGNGCICARGYTIHADKCIINSTNTNIPTLSLNSNTEQVCPINSYWTGYRCACKVGYKLNQLSGTCERFSIDKPEQTCSLNQFFNGISCQCLPNYYRNSDDRCVKQTISCPPYSSVVNGRCFCYDRYTLVNGVCVPDAMQCEDNRIDNGVGQCVCRRGFYEDASTGQCVEGVPCPQFSYQVNGECICVDGYIKTQSGSCSLCEEGFFYSNGSCIILCKQNQLYNTTNKQCQCKAGFGIANEKCQLCDGDTFLKDGFCVSCPINSVYDIVDGGCVCSEGWKQIDGLCVRSCGINEIYIVEADKCECVAGLGRVNGQCATCPVGQQPNPVTFLCEGCRQNETLSGGQCICSSGYGYSNTGQCINCADINQFLFDGSCAVCPPNKQWNGQSCTCKPGYQQLAGQCTQKCTSTHAIDANGRCYSCPINEYVFENQCVCEGGYGRSASTGRCEIMCQGSQILIDGRCGICALNSVYNPILGVCICPTGTYKNSNGYCEQFVPTPITCSEGEYRSDEGCQPCAAGCASCTSAEVCVGCALSTYEPRGETCFPICGDGIIIFGVQHCDDANTRNSDGCSSICHVEEDYTCTSQPSICKNTSVKPTPINCGDGIVNSNQVCDDGNLNNGDGCDNACEVEAGWTCPQNQCYREPYNMILHDEIISNSGAVYLTIKTSFEFVFNSQTQMRNFLKFEFRAAQDTPASAFCNQDINQKDIFRCVPLYPYIISLSYEKDGKIGYLDVHLDLRISQMALRSLN